MTKTWIITDLDGSNRRRVTLAQYRVEVEAAKRRAEAIHAADKASLKFQHDRAARDRADRQDAAALSRELWEG